MPAYYLDIETTGLDPTTHSIITVQYQELERYTGKPKGGLRILKSWESDEHDMLEEFVRDTGINPRNRFGFIPVGYNLAFENKFLHPRLGINITEFPHVDLHHTAIIMNHGEFVGSGLDKMTGKPHSGSPIPDWYRAGQYDKIIQYIEEEATAFCDFYAWLLERLPAVHREFVDGRA